jgi:hypothetical protein
MAEIVTRKNSGSFEKASPLAPLPTYGLDPEIGAKMGMGDQREN